MRANKEQRIRIRWLPTEQFSGMRSGFNQVGFCLRKYEVMLSQKKIQKIIAEKS